MANKILRQITVFILMLTMVAAAIPSAAFAEEVTVSGGEETVATSAGSGEKADTQKDDSEEEMVDTNSSEENTSSTEEVTSTNDDADDDADDDTSFDETYDTGNQSSDGTEGTDGETDDDNDILDTGEEQEEDVIFDEQMTVDGVTVRVTADEGVFPQGAYLEVKKVSVSEEKDALEAVKEEVDGKIAESYTFDITIYDKDGNEIQPDTGKGSVNVSFTTGEVGQYDTSVFHMDGDEADKLETQKEGETATVKTDGFSVYMVVFTYCSSAGVSTELIVKLPYRTTEEESIDYCLITSLFENFLHMYDVSIESAYCENKLVDVYQVEDRWMIKFRGSVSDAVLFVDAKTPSADSTTLYAFHLYVSLQRNKVTSDPSANTENMTYNGENKELLSKSGDCQQSDPSSEYTSNMRYALADEFGEPPVDSGEWTGNSTLLKAKDAGEYKVFYYAKGTNDGTYADSEMRSLKVTIKKRQVAIQTDSIKAKDKEYDGNANASVDCGNVVFVDPDTKEVVHIAQDDKIGLTGVTGEFSDKNKGDNKTVTLDYTNATLTGAKAGNYELVVDECPYTSEASITAKPVTVSKIKAVNKSYDGNVFTKIEPAISGETPEVKGVIAGDAVDFSTDRAKGQFKDANAGTDKTVTIVPESQEDSLLTGSDAANYVFDAENCLLSASIYPKEVVVTGFKAEDKVYDGNAKAKIDTSKVEIAGVIDPEELSIKPNLVTGTFVDSGDKEDPDTGNGKKFILKYDDDALVGVNDTDSANYTIKFAEEPGEEGSQTTAEASITKRPVWVTRGIRALDKVYDGDRGADIDCTNAVIDNVVQGDVLHIEGVNGTFDTKDVGKNINVSLDYTEDARLVGEGAENYSLASSSEGANQQNFQQKTTASISPRPVEIQWLDANGKVSAPGQIIQYTYDGKEKQPTAKVKKDSLAPGKKDKVEPVVIGAEVNAGSVTYYAEVTSLNGADSKNYCLPISNIRKKFKINPREVTIDWSNTSLVYNGRRQLPTARVKGLLKSDTCGVTSIVTDKDSVNAGTYTATASKLTNNNYKPKKNQKTSFTIKKKKLTVKAKNKTIRYGDKPSNNGVIYKGFVSGEDKHNLGGKLKFRYSYKKNAKPGTYTITPYGHNSRNYAITYKKGKLKVRKKVTILVGKVSSQGKSKAILSWNGISDADRYVIYFAKCSKHLKKIATLGSWRRSITKKGLKKGQAYKFKIVAQKRDNGSYKKIASSKQAHLIIGNKNRKYTNQKNLKVPKKTIKLKPGKTYKIKASYKKFFKDKGLLTTHANKLRYVSSNKKVATVSENGRIKAVKTGSCSIYVQTINGKWKTITVNVAK